MLIHVPLGQIEDNPFQPRRDYPDVDELAGRIAAVHDDYPDTAGLMQVPRGRLVIKNSRYPEGEPITDTFKVPENPQHWDQALRLQLAFGHRRKRAFDYLQQNGNGRYAAGCMPVHVDSLTDDQMLDAVWSENVERKDLSAVEEAELLRAKLERVRKDGGSQVDVAEAWGLDRSTVAHRLRLLELPQEIQQANREGRLSERQALALAPVVQLGQAVDGRWEAKQSWQPISPVAYVEEVASGKKQPTSEEIREYSKRAHQFAGEILPDAIACAELEGKGLVQSLCKGCPRRVQQTCLKPDCLAGKKSYYGRDLALAAADELGYPYSDAIGHFKPFDDHDSIRELLAIHAAGGCGHLVVGWQEEGTAARPFHTGNWLYGENAYARDSRAGVVIGHAGNLKDRCLAVVPPEEEGEPAEDIPGRATIEAWGKAAKKQFEDARKRAIEAVADALQFAVADFDVIQALVWSAETEWTDDGVELSRRLARWLWDKGRGFDYSYDTIKGIEKISTLLDRAGIGRGVLASPDKVQALRDRAILALDCWYSNRDNTWTDSYALTAKEHLAAAIEAFEKAPLTMQPAELRFELGRAQRDVERFLEERAARAAESNVRIVDGGDEEE